MGRTQGDSPRPGNNTVGLPAFDPPYGDSSTAVARCCGLSPKRISRYSWLDVVARCAVFAWPGCCISWFDDDCSEKPLHAATVRCRVSFRLIVPRWRSNPAKEFFAHFPKFTNGQQHVYWPPSIRRCLNPIRHPVSSNPPRRSPNSMRTSAIELLNKRSGDFP